MKLGKIYYCFFIPVVFFFVLSFGSECVGQDSNVFFDCGDIGTEARRILSNLNEERLRIEERQKVLDRREDELKILQLEVDKKLSQLQELKEELDQMFAQKDEVERDKVKKLSLIYQKRDPSGAAATLASMDKYLAVSILSMMRDKSAGKILDQMDKQKAVEYSTALGRLKSLESNVNNSEP
jgi:flagellar motility protein MotE (MotC chaperone)